MPQPLWFRFIRLGFIYFARGQVHRLGLLVDLNPVAQGLTVHTHVASGIEPR